MGVLGKSLSGPCGSPFPCIYDDFFLDRRGGEFLMNAAPARAAHLARDSLDQFPDITAHDKIL